MALPFPIAATQTDAKSPVDQQLMDAFRLNQEFLDSQLGGASAGGILNFRVNGLLTRIKALLDLGAGKRLDGGIITNAVTFTKASLYLEKGGTAGAIEVDVLRHKEVQHAITSIEALYADTIDSVGRLGTSLNTQAVTREASDINTQLINRFKPTINVESVQAIDGTQMLVNFSGTTPLDEDYKVGSEIVISGVNANTDGTWEIKAVNVNGLPSVLLNNSSPVNSGSPGGVAELNLYEFVANASVDPAFFPGEEALFAGHADGDNNGYIEIYKINQGGNNIIAYVSNGSTQGSAQGTITCLRLRYVVNTTVDPDIYVTGEVAEFLSHSAATNNGQFPIVAINQDSGNNIVIYNNSQTGGSPQGGAAGIVSSERWVYSLPTDPDGIIEVGDKVTFAGQSQNGNNGTFEVKIVKQFGVDNIVVYNPNGEGQGSAEGTVTSEKKQVNFAEDFSAAYLVNESYVQFEGLGADTDQAFEKQVVEVNRGGFSNYNIVVLDLEDIAQVAAAGRVSREVRTIFDQRPRIEYTENKPRNLQKDISATFKAGGVDADSILTLEVLEVPDGLPSTLVLSLS